MTPGQPPPSALSELPDVELVRLAKTGELLAFEELVNRYERKVYTLAWRVVRHQQDAEDITQQTFLSALEHLGDFREEAAFSTWLLRIATFGALKILRKKRGLAFVSLEENLEPASESIPPPEFIADWRESPETLVGQKETGRIIDEALGRLDEKHRLVFLLRDVEGLSIRETSAALGLTEANVKVRLLRARLELREFITRALGDPETRLQPPRHG